MNNFKAFKVNFYFSNKNRYRSVGCDATVSDLQSGIFDVNIVNMVFIFEF